MVVGQTTLVEVGIVEAVFAVLPGVVADDARGEKQPFKDALGLGVGESAAEGPASAQFPFALVAEGVGRQQVDSVSGWADQGVLLLNATLTVRAHHAGSHQRHGWETFTDAAIQALSQRRNGIVFLLWGSYAIAKKALIDQTKHHVLTAPHPSPLSAYRGFFGCRHFSQCNNLLVQQGLEPIDWTRIR